MPSAAVPVIVITGTMGSGKTTVLGEASDILAARGVRHGAIDLDTLAAGHLPEAAWRDLAERNLAAVWRNFANRGATHLLIAEAMESAQALERLHRAVPESRIVVCRLRASLATMQRRVSAREPGLLRDTFVARVAELDSTLDRARLEDFSLVNDDECSITAVASALLVRAGSIAEGREDVDAIF